MKLAFVRVAALLVIATSMFCVATKACAAPHSAKNDLTEVVVPFSLCDNRIFTDVFLNGKGPFKVMFDTGGCLSITPKVAKELKCVTEDAGSATGAGEKEIPLQKTVIDNVRLGTLSLMHQECLILDYSEIQKKFAIPQLDGVIGYEFLKKYLVKFDYEKHEMYFSQFSNTRSFSGFSKISCHFMDGKPIISAKVQGRAAKILIDTGDRSALTVREAFAARESMSKLYENAPAQITGYGIGGVIYGKVARVRSMELAPGLMLTDVVSRMPTAKNGFNSMSDFDCSIGNEILKQFELIFDHHSNCLYMRPNRFFNSRTEFRPVAN